MDGELTIPAAGKPRKIILRCHQSPGDVVMLTAAIRDLKKACLTAVEVDVRTPCGHLWENNPHLTPLRVEEQDVEAIECHYPLIHRSNTGTWHFIHGFSQYLSEQLKLPIQPTEFKGDIHLSSQEKSWVSQVQEITREPVPFWIMVAGGKYDFTAKWWAQDRWQTVVDHFAGRILFVQVGEAGHHHPPLQRVLDLRGKTDLRQLVRLIYHSQGVLCPVTLAMHLAAAVPVRPGMPKNRPCVVVAGGREPSQWEAYPHHQYIHTNGALFCCDNGGCWKSRVVPIGDGNEKDSETNLCVDVVELATGRRQPGEAWARQGARAPKLSADDPPLSPSPAFLPRCLDLISAEEVIRRVQIYFEGGAVRFLSEAERRTSAAMIPKLRWKNGRVAKCGFA